MSFAHYLDTLLFAVLPYVAFVIFLIGTIQRYRQQTFTYSSLSSQLLENKHHFWALVPIHFGIIAVLANITALQRIALVRRQGHERMKQNREKKP